MKRVLAVVALCCLFAQSAFAGVLIFQQYQLGGSSDLTVKHTNNSGGTQIITVVVVTHIEYAITIDTTKTVPVPAALVDVESASYRLKEGKSCKIKIYNYHHDAHGPVRVFVETLPYVDA